LVFIVETKALQKGDDIHEKIRNFIRSVPCPALWCRFALASDSSEILDDESRVIPTVTVEPASDVESIASTVILNSDVGSSSGSVLAEEEKFDPRDRNHDGKVSFGEKVHYFFDRDKDGDVDFEDFKRAAKELLAKVKGIFDVNGNGELEFNEIIAGTQSALEHLNSLAVRIIDLSGSIQGSEYFSLIPQDVREPLTNLFAVVDEAAKKTQAGVNIGGTYVDDIENALEKLKGHMSHLLKGEATPEQMAQAKKDIFAYLEMIKGWYNTGDNTKLITSIEKKLSKAKA